MSAPVDQEITIMTEHEEQAERLHEQWMAAQRAYSLDPSMRTELAELEARHALEDHLDQHELTDHWTDPRGGYRR